jgi:hypothetical protein
MRGYSHMKEEALDRTMWKACFGRGFGPVVRQTVNELDEKDLLYGIFLVLICVRGWVNSRTYGRRDYVNKHFRLVAYRSASTNCATAYPNYSNSLREFSQWLDWLILLCSEQASLNGSFNYVLFPQTDLLERVYVRCFKRKRSCLPTYFPTYLLTYLLSYLLPYLVTYLLTSLLTSLLTYLLTSLLTFLPTYLPTHLLTYFPTYLPTYFPT